MQIAIVENKIPYIPNSEIRNKILDFESLLMQHPDAVFGENDLFPVKHSFSDKIYTREMFIPKGGLLTGRIWKHEFPFFLLKGEIIIFSESTGNKTIKAPCSLISKPGDKRVIFANEDSIITTVHYNQDNLTDTDICLDRMTCENYSEYEKFVSEQKHIGSSQTENCGLEALKKMSILKTASFKSLISMAKDNGLALHPYKVTLKELNSIPLPAIVHSKNHFSYITKKEDFNIELKYTGNVLLVKNCDYPKINTSELNKIKGETGVVVAIISAGVAVTTATIGLIKQESAKPKDECKKDCKEECKAKTGWLFAGRRKCIKKCRADNCTPSIAPPTPQEQGGINWWYVGAGILGAIAFLLFIFRKSIFK